MNGKETGEMEMKGYQHLLEPLKINEKYTFKNRVESAPMAFALIACDPDASQKSFRKLEASARGGDACVAVGELDVNFRDAVRIPLPAVDFTETSGFVVDSVGEYARRIHKHGAIALCELAHPGAEKMPFSDQEEAIGPNDEVRPSGVHVRAMNEEDMERIVNDFATCAKFVEACGYDGVVIHGGHGFLFTQFLSSTYNKRQDNYGGSLENRARFPLRVLKGIRDAMGKDFLIELRISGDAGPGSGITPEETGQFLHMCEGIVDMAQISAGLYYDAIATHQFSSMFVEHGCNASISQIVKKYTSMPIGVVGGINSPEQMEDIIANGMADYIVLGRQSLADPQLVNKVMAGKADTVRRCLRCFKCFPGSAEEGYTDIPFSSNELAKHVGFCTINPLANLPFDPYELPAAEDKKKVLIIGGGVAGMQAAITAADRGHQVVLVEKSEKMGGMLFFTDVDTDKPDLMNFKNLMIREVESRDIEVRLNTEADKKLIQDIQPDEIIIAVGSEPACPPIPGIENAHQSLDAYRGKVEVGKKVIMIGGGLIGAEQGLFLAKTGHEVTVIEMLPRIANEAYGMYRDALMREIEKEKMCILADTKCLEIREGEVKIQDADGKESVLSADTILYALGMKSVPTKDIEEWAGDIPCTVIGDAIKPGKVDQATNTGYMAAIKL